MSTTQWFLATVNTKGSGQSGFCIAHQNMLGNSETSFEAAAKRTLIHSPIIKYIFNVKVSVNKDLNNYEKEYKTGFRVFNDAITEEFDNSSSAFMGDTFNSADTLDVLLAAEDQQREEQNVTIKSEDSWDKNELQPYVPQLETVQVLVRSTSIVVDSNVYPLPSTVRSAAVLSGIHIKINNNYFDNEDSILISLSSGYLIMIRLILANSTYKPIVYMWHKIADTNTMNLTERLGQNIICHESGLCFAVHSYNNYITVFKCTSSDKGIYYKKAQNLKTEGTILAAQFFSNPDQIDGEKEKGGFNLFALVHTTEQRIQARTFEWVKDGQSEIVNRSVLPLFNTFFPCFVVSLRTSQSMLLVTESQLVIMTPHQIHSGVCDFSKQHFKGTFPVSYYQPKKPILRSATEISSEILIAASDGVIYLVTVSGANNNIDVSPLVKVKHFLSHFILERVDFEDSLEEAQFTFTFADEKSSGYNLTVRFAPFSPRNGRYRAFEEMVVKDKFYNWCPIYDLAVIDHGKSKTSHSSQDLWLCSGEAKNGSLVQMRYGINAEQNKTHTCFKKALNILPIQYSTEDKDYNYYFLVNYTSEVKLYSYLDRSDEMQEIPISLAIDTDFPTLLIKRISEMEALVQVTINTIFVGTLTQAVQKLSLQAEILMAKPFCDSHITYVSQDPENGAFQFICKKVDKDLLEASLSANEGSDVIKDVCTINLETDIIPSTIQVLEYKKDIFVFVGSLFGKVQVFKYEEAAKTFEKLQTIELHEFADSSIHHMQFSWSKVETGSNEIWFHVTDGLGSYMGLKMTLKDDRLVLSKEVELLHFASLPITLSLTKDKTILYLISKQLWQMSANNPSQAPTSIFFRNVLSEKTVFDAFPLLLNDNQHKMCVLKEDGLSICRFAETPDACPKIFHLGFTPNKIVYVSYLHLFCISSNDPGLPSRLSFFDTKNTKKVPGKEVLKHNKASIFGANEQILTVSEWRIKKKYKESVYKNIVVGCRMNKNEGSVHVLELKKDKSGKESIKINNLYSWKTDGPVFVLQQLHNCNTLIYSSGNVLYTRRYSTKDKTIKDSKKQYECGSLVVSVEVKSNKMIIVSTRSSSVAVFKYQKGRLEKIFDDSVSRFLINGIGFDNLVAVSDKLHFTVSGLKIEPNKLSHAFKFNTGTIGRLKKCKLIPRWFSDREKHQDNKFLVCGVGGEIDVFVLLTKKEFLLLKKSFIKTEVNDILIGSKGSWEIRELSQLYSNALYSRVLDLDRVNLLDSKSITRLLFAVSL